MNMRLVRGTLQLVGLGLLVVGLFRPAPLDAQAVTGRVVSADSLRGIPAAFIQVFDRADNRVRTGLTDSEGRYELELARDGEPFRLQVDAFGFARASVQVPPTLTQQTLAMQDIVLEPAPIVLDELSVRADRPRLTPGREWVRRNQLHGTGTFLAGAMIANDAPDFLGAYIADRTELWVTFNSRGQSALYNPRGARSRCVDVLVNRWSLRQTGYRTIDDIPAKDIAAIEIYESERDLPPGYYFEGRPGCGIVQVWLWNSW